MTVGSSQSVLVCVWATETPAMVVPSWPIDVAFFVLRVPAEDLKTVE